jgi:hypothetical protein
MSRTRSFSLLEVTVASSFLLAILLVASTTLQQTGTAAKFDQAQNEAASAARRILGQMTRELADSGGAAGIDHVSPDRATGAAVGTGVIFKIRTQLTGVDAVDWPDPQIFYVLQDDPTENPANAIDDDKDGVIDERRLVRIQANVNGGQPVVMDPSVTLFRIDRPPGSDVVTITLEVSRGWQLRVAQPGQWARTRMVTSVSLRNIP